MTDKRKIEQREKMGKGTKKRKIKKGKLKTE